MRCHSCPGNLSPRWAGGNAQARAPASRPGEGWESRQVLVIGEIRDEETAGIALRAALTGHLVISTLHAGSCKGVFERLLALCPDHWAAASSVDLVLNQRLVRRLCPDCGGRRCPSCLDTGYRGRLPILEWVRGGDALRRLLAARNLEAIAATPSLADCARGLIQSGVASLRDAMGRGGSKPCAQAHGYHRNTATRCRTQARPSDEASMTG